MTGVEIVCISGEDAGTSIAIGTQALPVGSLSGLKDRDVPDWLVNFRWTVDELYFRTFKGRSIMIDGMPVTEGALPIGQHFRMGGSIWEVRQPVAPAAAPQLLDSVAVRLNTLSGTEKLEGFSLSEFFSEVFKNRTPEEIDEQFVVGTARATPALRDVQTGWPKPWLFGRVLLFTGAIYAAFVISMQSFENMNLIPGLIMMGSLAIPLATLILFFELNTPRNIAFYRVLMLFCLGGIASIAVSLIGFDLINLDWLGSSQAGIIEEAGKLAAVILITRGRKEKYILNGLLFGAAVGAGFAAFESAGYAFRSLWKTKTFERMTDVIFLRAVLAPFGHVAWTAITSAALWRVKGGDPFQFRHLLEKSFWRTALVAVVAHMIWNSPLQLPYFLKQAVVGVASWYVVFSLAQQGLKQVRAEQIKWAQRTIRISTQQSSARG